MTAGPRLGSLGLIGGLLVLSLLASAWLLSQALPAAAPLANAGLSSDQLIDGLQARLAQQARVGLALLITVSCLCAVAALLIKRRWVDQAEQSKTLAERQQRQEAALREAELALQTRRDAMAQLGQEIRTPLQSLLGFLSLLRRTALTPQQADHLRLVNDSADHLVALLTDLLDLNQLEDSQSVGDPAPLALRALLRELEAMSRPQAVAKSLTLHLDAEPTVPAWISADGARLKQVLFKLVSHAIQVSAKGRIAVDARLSPKGADHLLFVITYEGAKATTGHGLNLDIAYRLARKLGGSVQFYSAPGEGERVHLDLPLPAAQPPAMPWHPAEVPAADTRPLTVLVAEDHPVNREYLASLLETLQHEAHFVANGVEAVKAVQHRHFDLVLMDLHMPELDGIGAAIAIRALPDRAAATVPIVALTADTYQDTRDRCRLAGMNEFLGKPVSPQDLAAAMRRLYGQAAAHAAAAPATLDAAPSRLDDHQLLAGAPEEPTKPRMARWQLTRQRLDLLAQGSLTVDRLRLAVRDGQPQVLRAHAQAAASEAGRLGLSALAETAQALQDGALHLPAHEIAHLVQRFEALLPRTLAAVQTAEKAVDMAADKAAGLGESGRA
jgi:signal transduction histidine kinase/CheY-like chemotaxis protein